MSSLSLPPGPKTKFAAGVFLELRRDPLGFLLRAARQYGDVCHLQLGPRHNYLVNNPEDIKNILVAPQGMARSNHPSIKRLLGKGLITSQGEFHRRHRRLVQPAFHKAQIAAWGREMSAEGERTSSRWKDGGVIEVGEEMSRATLAVIVKTMVSTDIEDSTGRRLGEAWSTVIGTSHLHKIPFLDELLLKLPLPRTRRIEKGLRYLNETIYAMIAERRNRGLEKPDLLSILLRVRDAEGDAAGLADEEIRDEILTMFTAGHETISSALTWTWHLLSLHPEVEAALHAEVDGVLEGGRAPGVDDLPRLPYTRMVLAESMRIYPPVWIIARRNVEDCQLGEHLVPAGSFLYLSQYVVHHDARYYPDPDRFDPTRWTPEGIASRPKYSYFPFGGGGRQCIGEGYAWTEGVLLLALLAQRWRLEPVPGQRIDIDPVITLRPKHGLRMTTHARHGAN